MVSVRFMKNIAYSDELFCMGKYIDDQSFHVCIRHYGLLSNQNKRRLIPICRNLIGCREFLCRFKKDDKAQAIRVLYKKDVTVCPCCGGDMSYTLCTAWDSKIRSSA